MKESNFRTKLCKEFRKNFPDSFIWANDAHFKSGMPDLMSITRTDTRFFELKSHLREPKDLLKGFTKIQLATIGRMVKAGSVVLGLIHVDIPGKVIVYDFVDADLTRDYPAAEFWNKWANGSFIF